MGNRLSSIITRTGDQGRTRLGDGSSVAKSHARIHCLGEIDELNSVLGLSASQIGEASIQEIFTQIQHDLFDLGAELSQPGKQLLSDEYLSFVENHAQSLNDPLPPLREFILPGGDTRIAQLHVTRAVCRRAERALVSLAETEAVNPASLKYLNRLSDLLFIIARHIAQQQGVSEALWQSRYSRQSKQA